MIRRDAEPRGAKSDCPSPQRLRSFLFGQLAADDLSDMTAHLGECRLCQARLGELDDSKRDPLASAALSSPLWPRSPDAGLEPDKSHFLAMLSQLGKKCGLDLPTSWRNSLDEPPPDPPASTPASQPVPQQLGQYQLLEVIGEGGMGIVYRVRHVVMKREQALKLLHPSRVANAPDLARFYREIEAVARLEHPHIVVGHDAQEAQGHHFLVMEFVSGLNLSQLLGALGKLPIADACELVRQAAVGLEYAHAHGLVHRDIKPSNLLLSDRGVVKILDLGLASQRTDDRTDERDVVLGTADYIAPEQWISADRVDRRADVYSLGCTLYQLLVGRPPFGDLPESYRVKAEAHCQRAPAAARSQRSEIPAALEQLLERMLAKRPEDRPASAAEVATALARFAAGSDPIDLLKRAGHHVDDTVRIPRAQLSTLFNFKSAGRRVSRRGALAVLLALLLTGGGLAFWLIPRWRPAEPLPRDPRAAHWSRGHEGESLTLTDQGGYRVAAGEHPGMVLLGTLERGVYRLSTTVTLHARTGRAGLYFDDARSLDGQSSSTAQAIVFVKSGNGRYSLQWQRILFQGSQALEQPGAAVGSFHPNSPLRLDVECGAEGVRAVWCNGKLMHKDVSQALALRDSGGAGLLVSEGEAEFGPTTISFKE
ncbi:MAG: serine/threonine-protein kinase [Pirellulales bacterium]